MKKIFSTVTTLLSFFCFMQPIFSQSGGGSLPDTTIESAVYFVSVPHAPHAGVKAYKKPVPGVTTYMAIITGYQNTGNTFPPKNRASHVSFYKLSCADCNILKWSSGGSEGTGKTVSPIAGSAELVTDPELKRQLLKALQVQSASSGRLLQREIGSMKSE